MKTYRFSCALALIATMAASAQAPEANPNDKIIVLVEPGTSVVEAKSLLPDTRLSATQATGMLKRESVMAIGPDNRSVDVNNMIPDMAAEKPDASAYYRFQLLPKEELTCDLKSQNSSKIWMQFMTPKQSDAMSSQFRRANLPPVSSRARRIRITNITDAPYEVALALFGWSGYSYALTIKRQGGVQPPPSNP